MDKEQVLSFIEYAKRNNAVRIKLSSMELTELPNEIFLLLNLEELFLYNNQLYSLPIEITNLTKLNHLDLRNNKFENLPNEIGQLKNLKTLRLNDNKIKASELSKISALSNLDKLHLRSNGFSELPEEIGLLTSLSELDISFNNISRLPIEFSHLTNLVTLQIGNNKFSDFPLPITSLTQLLELHFQNNLISSIPPQIGELGNLSALNFEGNRLVTDVPIEFAQLTNLSILNLGKTGFETFPKPLCQLTKLTELYLHQNNLTSLPTEINNLTNLVTLDLASNKLTTLPVEIQQLTELKYLDLRGNPLPIPPEILEKRYEPKDIINYYIEHIKSQKRLSMNECKLLFVGQGSVGKTSLVHRILYSTFDQNQTKTDGISIKQWQVEGREKRKSDSQIKLNIWDFGGQEIMHATHQFFLTKRSLYLLVLDARLTQEENRVEYWLKIIQSFGGESPVLIVGNKTDQHPLDIDRTGLQKKYPNIVGILETSAATGVGIESLKTEIAKQVDTLPHVRDLLPEAWFTVKSKLEELGKDKNFIAQDEYLDLCDANDVTDETSKHTLIGFLHDLGVVLHFQDDPRLESLGILNPQWVTNGVYKILNSHELFQNQGRLTLSMLNNVLNLPEYPSNKRLFIVDMMKKFELCYDIEPDKSFLIPDLLPKDEPYTGVWDSELAFQIHYNILPSSIITRFIVRMNAFVHKTVWRSGVVLKSGGNTALVKADYEDRIIYIWVSGDENTRRDFLSAIRVELDAIHKTIAKIDATEKVPLSKRPEVIFDYQELLQFERDGIFDFPKSINGRSIKISVQQLLDGVATQEARQHDAVDSLRIRREPGPIIFTGTYAKKKTLLRLILTFIFAKIPKAGGRLLLDIFGRDRANESTAIIIGYVVAVIIILIVLGIINPIVFLNAFTNLWRFFFPLK